MDELRNPVAEALCRDQLEKIAGSVTFARAEQLRELLRWLGVRALGNHAKAPSEKEIAHQVLKRPDFDPRADALVRKEMGRLREKLSRYYLSEGLRDPVCVKANSGYQIRFEHRAMADTAACWLVLPFRAGADILDTGVELLEELLVELRERGGPELVSPATALAYRDRSGDLRQFAVECRADFVVEGSLRRRAECFEAMIWFVDGRSGRTRRSRRISGADAAELANVAVAWLLEAELVPQT